MDEIKELKKMVKDLAATVERQQKQIDKLAKKPAKKKERTDGSLLREHFCIEYHKRFGHEYPLWGPKESTLAKSVCASVSLEKAKWLINWYLQWNDPFITKNGHPFNFFQSNIVKLEAQLRGQGRYYERVARANASDRQIIGTMQEKAELELKDEIRTKQRSGQNIGFFSRGELPTEATGQLPPSSSRSSDGSGEKS